MDTFDVVCQCGTEIAVRVPSLRTTRAFTCPGCGRALVVDGTLGGQPYPQHDTSDSPAVQATVLHFGCQDGE